MLIKEMASSSCSSSITCRARTAITLLRFFLSTAFSIQFLRICLKIFCLPCAIALRVCARLDNMRYKKVDITVGTRLEALFSPLSCDSTIILGYKTKPLVKNTDRILPAEWVLSNEPNWCEGLRTNVALLLHGGFFVALDSQCYRPLSRRLAKLGFSVLAIDYRLAPENPFPASLHDACAAYLWLLTDIGVPSNQILIVGEGSGANLAMSLVAACEEKKIPLPGGICLLSPHLDLDPVLPSLSRHKENDYLSVFNNKRLNVLSSYAGKNYEKNISGFLSQPLVDICRERPTVPVLIQSSQSSQLSDCVERFIAAQVLSGPLTRIEHDVLLDLPHAAHLLGTHLKITNGCILDMAFLRIWRWWMDLKRQNSKIGIQRNLLSASGSTRSVEISISKRKGQAE